MSQPVLFLMTTILQLLDSADRSPDNSRMYNPAPNLMYSFSNESGLKSIYNMVGYTDFNSFDMSILPFSDAQLVNPFYMGIAVLSRTPYGGCIDRSDCTIATHERGTTWREDGCGGRFCGAPTGQALEPLITIYPTLTRATHHGAKSTHVSSISTIAGEDRAEAYHALELAGNDQDTLPIIVSGVSGEPVTALADIGLTLMENYASSGMLEALGVSSTSSHTDQWQAIAKPDQRVAALGRPVFRVTPHANVSLNLLAGPKDASKQFASVNFNVFDLPSPSQDGTFVWQPEVFLGVAFLRDATASRLAEDFAGNPAPEGVAVLARGMKTYEFSFDAGKLADGKRADRKKDEL
ncbi:hypothetical protein A1O7_09169 [Cladophialophora yegresii CBS 114405]|uniref:Uncharacterized protein n=1 Tax=Cladophialophora yegresii CBS 114405 TaxID=1182544 RepID=W9VEE1_9EURO|nr:uncharacterized protein A1O7_09169 [Cladophialophora yegresii CBS 114405]EXJ53833.1 hypothetical protein A1O7_09169 [Cladophialophora yegresii CBS 114405]